MNALGQDSSKLYKLKDALEECLKAHFDFELIRNELQLPLDSLFDCQTARMIFKQEMRADPSVIQKVYEKLTGGEYIRPTDCTSLYLLAREWNILPPPERLAPLLGQLIKSGRLAFVNELLDLGVQVPVEEREKWVTLLIGADDLLTAKRIRNCSASLSLPSCPSSDHLTLNAEMGRR